MTGETRTTGTPLSRPATMLWRPAPSSRLRRSVRTADPHSLLMLATALPPVVAWFHWSALSAAPLTSALARTRHPATTTSSYSAARVQRVGKFGEHKAAE